MKSRNSLLKTIGNQNRKFQDNKIKRKISEMKLLKHTDSIQEVKIQDKQTVF